MDSGDLCRVPQAAVRHGRAYGVRKGSKAPVPVHRSSAIFYGSTAKFYRSTANFTGPPLFFIGAPLNFIGATINIAVYRSI